MRAAPQFLAFNKPVGSAALERLQRLPRRFPEDRASQGEERRIGGGCRDREPALT